MDIGERIRERRESLGMTQSELARAVGYTSRSTINKIERDGRGISQDKIVAIAKALKVTPSCASKKAVGSRLFFWIGAYEYD